MNLNNEKFARQIPLSLQRDLMGHAAGSAIRNKPTFYTFQNPRFNSKDFKIVLTELNNRRKQKSTTADLIILSKSQVHKAHYQILSSCSKKIASTPCFKNCFFRVDQHKISGKSIEYILDYIYVGKIDVLIGDLEGFGLAVEYFEIKELVDQVELAHIFLFDEESSTSDEEENEEEHNDHQELEQPSESEEIVIEAPKNEFYSFQPRPYTLHYHSKETISKSFNTSPTTIRNPNRPTKPGLVKRSRSFDYTDCVYSTNSINNFPNSTSSSLQGRRSCERMNYYDHPLMNHAHPSYSPSSFTNYDAPQLSKRSKPGLLKGTHSIDSGLPGLISYSTSASNSHEDLRQITAGVARTSLGANMGSAVPQSTMPVSYANIGNVNLSAYLGQNVAKVIEKHIPQVSKEEKSEKMKQTEQEKNQEEIDKPYACSLCNKRFKRVQHKNRHFLSIHTNERPYPCNYCPKTFKRKEFLSKHYKRYHPGLVEVMPTGMRKRGRPRLSEKK